MAVKEVELSDEDLKGAVAGTEDEIFKEAVNDQEIEETEDGDEPDRSLEAMEEVPGTKTDADGEKDGDEDADDADKGEADEESDAENRDKETGRFKAATDDKSKADEQPEGKPRKGDPGVPLKAERERARTLEADLAKERTERAAERDGFKTEFAKLEGRLDQMLRTQQPQPKPDESKSKTEEPDIFTDPEGYRNWVKAEIADAKRAGEQTARDGIINVSMARAHETHKQTFEEAYGALTRLDPSVPENVAAVQRIRNAADPGIALMRWHKQQRTLSMVGDDLDGFVNKQVEQAITEKMKDPEFRKQMLADMQAEARGGTQQNGGRPNHIIRKQPPSLNGAAGRGEQQLDPRIYDDSEKSVFDSVFDS